MMTDLNEKLSEDILKKCKSDYEKHLASCQEGVTRTTTQLLTETDKEKISFLKKSKKGYEDKIEVVNVLIKQADEYLAAFE